MKSLMPYNQRRSSSVFDLMDEFVRGMDTPAHWPLSTEWNKELASFNPMIDIEEKDGVYHITADIPGMKKEDIKVDLSENVLTICGERVREEKGDGKYFERSYGKFSRSFSLPKTVNHESVNAKYDNGVLHIDVPQQETKSAKAIKIN